jgi:outer membrane protein TolC
MLQQSVYSGGQRSAEMRAAEAQSHAACFNLSAVQNQLVFRVAEAYYRVLQAQQLVEVRREAVEQVSRHREIVESRFRNGTAVKSDVLTVDVRLSEVREALISAENQSELAWAVLKNVVGTHVEPGPLPTEVPPAPWTDHVDEVEAAISRAILDRPETGQLSNLRQAAAEGIDAARAGKRPTVDFLADYDVYTGDFRDGNDSFFVGLVVRLNLFDGGRTRNEVERAVARYREALSREQRLSLDIELDVQRSHLELHSAAERLKVATQAIEQAQETLREIEVRYRGQTATITQLVDAQVALSNARVRRTTAQADIEIARVSLARALGRLAHLLEQ